MVINYWNPQLMNQMALPPCHYCYEFLSDGESVDLLFNMRSVDCFLGMPFDIAHYAMLLLLICKQVNMKPGKLIGFFADTHIYVNHLDQVKEQLSRTPFESPSVEILNANDPKWTIWDWSYTDFELHDYQCHPAIKAPVAV
jgi:thymidylate synthase